MKPAIPVLALILLAACRAPTSVPEAPDDCGAQALQDHIGRPAESLPQQEGRVRIIPPGSAVTMDYFAGRLNVELDAQGRITRLYCG